MHEHVGVVGGDPKRFARLGVAGEDQLASGPGVAHDLLRVTPRMVSPRCTRPNSGPGSSPSRAAASGSNTPGRSSSYST